MGLDLRRAGAGAGLCLALAVAGCGRGADAPAGPATHEEAMTLASKAWELNRWTEVFAACEKAFALAEKERGAGVVRATECATEAAARAGRPAIALPLLERLAETHAERLRTASGRLRLANNHGVLLIEQGRRAEGVARLEWALRDFEGASYATSGASTFKLRAALVANLARAYYATASDPAVRAWVEEQASFLHDHMDPKVRGAQFAMGAAAALDALVAIGKRQANTNTPAWEARIRDWEPLEEEIAAKAPHLARPCEDVPLRTTVMEACLRELAPPARD